MPVENRKLIQKLDSLSRVDMRAGISNAVQMVQAEAKLLCMVESGELRQSIVTQVGGTESYAVGFCYTTEKYAGYVEFGTGPGGEAQHAGISPAVSPAYPRSPWWIHESQIDRRLAEKYRWQSIRTKEGIFYCCAGQPARPFLYPALRNNEKKAAELIAGSVRKEMK